MPAAIAIPAILGLACLAGFLAFVARAPVDTDTRYDELRDG
ncbi:MAG: hypothetical protein ACJ8AD_14740 [Gemmatimonadaceae bacterium]